MRHEQLVAVCCVTSFKLLLGLLDCRSHEILATLKGCQEDLQEGLLQLLQQNSVWQPSAVIQASLCFAANTPALQESGQLLYQMQYEVSAAMQLCHLSTSKMQRHLIMRLCDLTLALGMICRGKHTTASKLLWSSGAQANIWSCLTLWPHSIWLVFRLHRSFIKHSRRCSYHAERHCR